ncbi:hypothetical protein HW555_012886 [Spodoptera exigua]|uniref:THAP-type domain-containing protein n=1 Tax=Spodoptera exigua TaxID=7107 RepID=A0A835L0A8_SPOEX|nr:hypothetical protein HW555_012886 [Spodoptera exigua]
MNPLHKFPNQYSRKLEQLYQFKKWKSVLQLADQEKRDDYICKKIRICGRHFNENYRLPSHYLTLPTLFLDLNPMSAAEPIPIFSGVQEKSRSISYLNTKKKLQEMDTTAKRTILFLKNSIEKLREKYKKH